jgi:acyl-homoserine-lactone acylase
MRSTFILLLIVTAHNLFAQKIDPKNVQIIRDEFGVPHIYAKTDAEVAYGLAWAHSEDDFLNIQYNGLAGKGLLGRVIGKEGALFDFGLEFLDIPKTIEEKYDTDISADYKKVIDGYVQGVNDYAAAHPEEVLYKKAFPITSKELLQGSILQTSLMSGVGMALKSINDRKIREFYQINEVGSNAMAIDGKHTEDGKTYFCANSHQPIEGRFAWYEAHLSSEEGWDVIGGLFPGGTTIFVGTNKKLGWSHTVNFHTFGDIYEMEINPKNKKQYKYDGEWKNFGVKKVKLKVKVAGLKIPVTKKVLLTEYGPTLKNKDGLYAIRFPGYKDIRATEQWYRMNKSTHFEEFETALKMQGIPLFNTVYGDHEGNIMLHSGGMVPDRDKSLDWSQPIKGNSSKYKWDKIVSYDRMPTVINPECGFVYNCNQSPLFCAGEQCEWNGDFVGLQKFQFNRGERFKDMLEGHEGKFTWEDFHRIKFDKNYHPDKKASYLRSFSKLYNLDESKYPKIADAIQSFKRWNLSGEVDNKEASLALVTHDFLLKKFNAPFGFFMIAKYDILESDLVEAVNNAKNFLIKHHGSMSVPLGTVQRHIRGDVSIPASGLKEVPRAADGKLFDKKNGIYRIVGGDGYIQMVKFSKNETPEIYSINAYGSSSKEGSPHYTDQMELFQQEKFKTMTFDKNEILKKAELIYYPGEKVYFKAKK